MHTPEALVRSHVVYNAKVEFETYFLFVPVVLSASTIFTTQWRDIYTRSGTLWAVLNSKCTLRTTVYTISLTLGCEMCVRKCVRDSLLH